MVEVASLLGRAQSGDDQALEQLIRRFDRYVFGVALLILGDRVEAQDAAQEALIKTLRGLKGFDGRSSFQTWLYRITVNVCRDLWRRQNRRREQPLDELALPAGAGPMDMALDQERQVAVWAAVQSLDLPLREVVVLRYFLELPCSEIGRVTGAPTNTVYWRLHQARQQLEPLLLAQDVLAGEIATRVQKERG